MDISKSAPNQSDVKTDDTTPQEVDLERNEKRNSLERQLSGPPYSVFSPRMKIWIMVLVCASATISPLGATTFLPALNILSDELKISSASVNISITTYMVAQAIAPAIIGGMSDTSGRRVSFIVCFVIFIVANVGLALQTSYAALLVLRVLQAIGCSAAISLSIAVVADLATSAERGKYMGYASAGILLGPAFGPTIGGILAQYLGWRSTFWFLAIYAGVLLVCFVIAFPETCREVVGNGSIPARGLNLSVIAYFQQRKLARTDASSTSIASEKRKFQLPNPIGTLRILGEKESCIVLLYNGLFFTGLMVTTSAIPDLFKTAYNLNELNIGLCYIASGAGALISSLTMGHVVDWNFRRHAAALNITITKGRQQDLSDFPIEKVRLQIVVPGHLIGIVGLIAFGWTVKFRTHLVGPEIALFVAGFGITTAFNNTNALLIDLHRTQPATATAAVNLVRCLMSAGGCAAIIPMCNAMNPGWAFTLIALVYVVLVGVVFIVMAKGMKWRQEAEDKRNQKEATSRGGTGDRKAS